MLQISVSVWALTVGVIVALLALDLALAAARPHAVSFREAVALGLRALYFLVKGLLDRLVYLSTGLAVILAFIGVKLILHWRHTVDDRVPEVPTWLSLAVIVGILLVATVASVIKVRRDPDARAHAGSLHERSRDREPPARSRADA